VYLSELKNVHHHRAMFVLISDISARRRTVIEIRALHTPSRMYARLLREVDLLWGAQWRHTCVCNLFLCQSIDGHSYANSLVEGIWETRRPGAFVRVILNAKSPSEIEGDARRLAVAMAFHRRLGEQSHMGKMDLLVVLELILWFSGPQLV
jgi:hypothetical protein